MKKRRMKLLALMLTAAVTFTSVLPVGATATNGSEAPQQVTELTDPLDEGGGVTDNGQGNTDVSRMALTRPEMSSLVTCRLNRITMQKQPRMTIGLWNKLRIR